MLPIITDGRQKVGVETVKHTFLREGERPGIYSQNYPPLQDFHCQIAVQ